MLFAGGRGAAEREPQSLLELGPQFWTKSVFSEGQRWRRNGRRRIADQRNGAGALLASRRKSDTALRPRLKRRGHRLLRLCLPLGRYMCLRPALNQLLRIRTQKQA